MPLESDNSLGRWYIFFHTETEEASSRVDYSLSFISPDDDDLVSLTETERRFYDPVKDHHYSTLPDAVILLPNNVYDARGMELAHSPDSIRELLAKRRLEEMIEKTRAKR